jgi:uncharacterized membrane protein YqjE
VTAPALSKPAAPSAAALLRVVRGAGGPLLTQAGLHAELLRVEWQETRVRLQSMLLASLLGFACLLCLMLTLGALVLALCWTTPLRYPAMVALGALYASGAALAWRKFQLQSALSAEGFAATRTELAADLALLRQHLQ